MKLQKDIATYRVLFRNKEKSPIPVTAERAAKIMDKLSRREFIAIQDMDGTVHGEQWSNIESVDPISKKDLRNKGTYCWGDFYQGNKIANGVEREIFEIRKMNIYDLSVEEKYTGYYGDRIRYPENYPDNFVTLV